MADLPPALRQATFLIALAHHLTMHAHLAAVVVHSDGLQIAGTGPAAKGSALLAWADTLTDPTAIVRNIDGAAFVYVAGSAGPAQVRVWTVVPGLLSVLSPALKPDDPDRSLSAAGLRTLISRVANAEQGSGGGG
jgi:hypothetical protein